MAEYNKPIPEPDPVSQPFWDGAKAGKLMLPLIAKSKDHSKDQALQKAWKAVLPKVQKDEGEETKR